MTGAFSCLASALSSWSPPVVEITGPSLARVLLNLRETWFENFQDTANNARHNVSEWLAVSVQLFGPSHPSQQSSVFGLKWFMFLPQSGEQCTSSQERSSSVFANGQPVAAVLVRDETA